MTAGPAGAAAQRDAGAAGPDVRLGGTVAGGGLEAQFGLGFF